MERVRPGFQKVEREEYGAARTRNNLYARLQCSGKLLRFAAHSPDSFVQVSDR